MADGLEQAGAAAKSARMTRCPTCGQTVLLRVSAVTKRIPFHGPKGNPCRGSGQEVTR